MLDFVRSSTGCVILSAKVWGASMDVIRKVGALVIAAAAIVVWFAMAPGSAGQAASDANTSVSAIDLAMVNDTINQAGTAGAPQQAVANGWATRDLLEILARQGADRTGADMTTDKRPAALLVLAVFGVALMLFTSGIPRTQGPRDESKQSSEFPPPEPTAEVFAVGNPSGPSTGWTDAAKPPEG